QDRTEAAAGQRANRRRHHTHASAEADPKTIGLACRMAQPKGPVRGQKCAKKMAVAKQHPPHGCCPGSSCLRGTPLELVKGNKSGWCYCNDGYEPDETTDGFCRKIPPRPCVGLNVAC